MNADGARNSRQLSLWWTVPGLFFMRVCDGCEDSTRSDVCVILHLVFHDDEFILVAFDFLFSGCVVPVCLAIGVLLFFQVRTAVDGLSAVSTGIWVSFFVG